MISDSDRMKEFKKVKVIGEGTYGTVYKAIDTKDNSDVAIKEIKFENTDEGVPSTALREISILKTLSHPYIVELKEVIYSTENFKENLSLIFEYLDTDLHQLLIDPEKTLSKWQIQRIFQQLVEAVAYFHDNGFIHRDIKPSNILVDTAGNIKVADLGLSRMFTFPLREYTHEVCSLYYRPPEVLLGQKLYSVSLDIWSLGCTFAELFTKKPFLAGDSEIGQIFKIFQFTGTPTDAEWDGVENLPNYKPLFPKFKKPNYQELLKEKGMDDLEIDLLLKILILDPRKRMTAAAILQHDYFKANYATKS
jgi:serine/threonine protein kinase